MKPCRPFTFTKRCTLRIKPEELFTPLLKVNFIGTSSVAIRHTLIDKNVEFFSEKMKNSDDRLLWTQLSKKHSFGFINKALHSYRVRAGSISVSGGTKNLENQIIGIKKTQQLCTTHEHSTIINRRLAQRRRMLLRFLVKELRLLKAIRVAAEIYLE